MIVPNGQLSKRPVSEFTRLTPSLAETVRPVVIPPSIRLLLATILALLLFAAVPRPALGYTSATITIDGDLSDWAGVMADPANTVGDTVGAADPDYPGQPDRDASMASVTSDGQYLYFSWRRTASGTKAITFGAYIDRNGDGKLTDGDLVVNYVVSSGQPTADAHAPSPSAWILVYNQARTKSGNTVTILNPGGDNLTNMGADGDTPDGWASIQDGQVLPVQPMDAQLNLSNGIECEARVAWSDLGLSPDSPIKLHMASGNGNSWGTKYAPSTSWKWVGSPAQYLEENRGQVEDNIGSVFSLRRGSLTLTPNNFGAGAAGSWVTYTHVLTNIGNAPDIIDLSAASANGWPTRILSASGSEVASVTLAAGASTTITLRVLVPAGTPDDTRDAAVLNAISRSDHSATASAVDVTAVGSLAVYPNRSGTMAPGQTIEYSFVVGNSTGAAGQFDLTTSSSMGFSRAVMNTAGQPISAVSLASGESTTVVVRVSVPSTATIGAQDVTQLTAVARANPLQFASASATTQVMAGLDVSPDRSASAGPGTYVTYAHTVTNSWPTSRTVTLSTTDALGWPATIYDSDGVTPITSLSMGPNGATHSVYVRVFVPSTASVGAGDSTTLIARSGTDVETAVDTTVVGNLALFDTAACTNQTSLYEQGDTVYARGAGLGAYSDVYFVWKDPNGTVVRTSPSRAVDTRQMAYDDYGLPTSAMPGTWTCELHYARNGSLIDTSTYEVRLRAQISGLWSTDAAKIGQNVTIDASHVNNSPLAITESTATYTIWWDSNGDSTFNAGDLYVDSGGAPHAYDGTSQVSTHVTTGISVAGSGGTWGETAWSMSNAQFPNQGTYRVSEVWKSSAGEVIDTKVTQFFSVPTLGEWMAAVADSGPRSLPFILLAGALWLALTVYLYRTRRWLRMYLLGAFGFVMFALFFSQALSWDSALEAAEARNALLVASWLQMRLELLGSSGLAIRNHVGWGVFDVGIECSALLEMAAFAGLVAFYPGFRREKKYSAIALGLIATYAINIARIVIIVGMIAALGTSWVFIAHAVVGRVFFFVGIVIVYWYLLTRPTVSAVRVKIDPDAEEGERRG